MSGYIGIHHHIIWKLHPQVKEILYDKKLI